MNRLLIAMQRLPGLVRSRHLDYLEALDRTWEWVSRDICRFQQRPHLSIQEGLVKWINGYLYWRIRDLAGVEIAGQERLDKAIGNAVGDRPITRLDQISEGDSQKVPMLSSLDAHIEIMKTQAKRNIAFSLEQLIEEDPEGELRSCHPRKHPQCNCQVLSQRVLLKHPPDKFSTISRDLDVNYQTMKSHWEKKCKPLLQKLAGDLGYSTEETPDG